MNDYDFSLFFPLGDISKLTKALVYHSDISLAKKIQKNFENLLEEIFAREQKIWIESVSGSSYDGDEHKFGPEATTAEIIQNNIERKSLTVPYHLLGKALRYLNTALQQWSSTL